MAALKHNKRAETCEIALIKLCLHFYLKMNATELFVCIDWGIKKDLEVFLDEVSAVVGKKTLLHYIRQQHIHYFFYTQHAEK